LKLKTENLKLIPEMTRHISLLCLLLGVYLLTYSPRIDAIDGAATLAVAVSLVQRGSVDIAALGGAEGQLPPVSRMGTFGLDGQLYAKKGVAPSLALLPLVGVATALDLPMRAAGMLLNPLLTALTGVLVYVVAQQWGATSRVAYLTALLYGIGTLAWVYTKTLYGEPLAALLIMTALAAGGSGKLWGYAVAGGALGLLGGVNLAYGTLIPVIVIGLMGLNPRRWQWGALWRLGLALALMGSLLLAYNLVRFGNPFTSGYNFAQGEGFTAPIGEGALGLWLSPYRGLLWYSPLLWLGVLALPLRAFRSRRGLCLALLITVTLTFGAWWSWHGGVTWGTRFLVPLVPCAALLLLPVVELALTKRRIWLFALVLFTVISVGVQVLGVLLDYQLYYVYLYRYFFESPVTGLAAQVVWDAALSPIVGHAALLSAGAPLDIALFAQGFNLGHFSAAMLVVGVGVFIDQIQRRVMMHHDPTPRPAPQRNRWLAVPSIFVIAACGWIVEQQRTAPTRLPPEYSALTPVDTLVVADAQIGAALLDMPRTVRAISIHAPTTPADPLAAGLWRTAKETGGYLWYVTWFAPNHADHWQERELWERYAFVREQPLLNYRAVLFDLRPPPPAEQVVGAQWGQQIELAAYGILVDATAIRVTLQWHALNAPAGAYTWFVHVVDAQGQIIAQQDRAPQGNYRPTQTWQADEHYTDYLACPLSPSMDTTGWRLRVGWISNGAPLPLTNTLPMAEGDFVWLPISTH
jgi:hypothetical protein